MKKKKKRKPLKFYHQKRRIGQERNCCDIEEYESSICCCEEGVGVDSRWIMLNMLFSLRRQNSPDYSAVTSADAAVSSSSISIHS